MKKYMLSAFLVLVFAAPLWGMQAASSTSEPQSILQGKSAGTGTAGTVRVPQISVVNIVLKSIDGQNVYADDGRVFPLESRTRIIRNIQACSMRIAELTYKNGVLYAVEIK